MSNEKKTSKRDYREEMITDDELGTLYIPEHLKEEGYVYRIVDADRPGRVEFLQRKGYEVVNDTSVKVGQNTVSNTSSVSSVATVELGKNAHRQGILMKIPEDLYRLRQEHKEKRNKETDAAMGKTGIPTQFGEISIGNDKQ